MNKDNGLLAKRIFQGDEEAFKILYEEFFHTLLAIACKYVESEVAKDIVQDTFFKLWTTPHKFSATTDLRDRAEVVSEDFFYNTVLEEEIFIRLQQAIEELPEKYRKVINLNLEGLSDKEVALRLGISIDAVKQQKKRGKDQLKEKLNHPFLLLLINFL